MKTLKEAKSFDAVMGKEFSRNIRINSEDTYQEDNSFMKRMEKIPFEDMNRQELQKIYKIALHGLKVRRAVDKALARIRLLEHDKNQSGTINHGLKYSEIYKRGREMLHRILEATE